MSGSSGTPHTPPAGREADSATDSLLTGSAQQTSHEMRRILPRIGFQEKLPPTDTVTSLSSEERVVEEDIRTDKPWKPTFFRLGPVLGLISLLFVLLSIPATGAVLVVSDGQPVTEWKRLKPNVYIAIFTGIGNKALAFAALQGAIISWWLRALKGTTLKRLHRDWAVGAGSNLWAILTSGITAGNLGISTICAGLIFIDGILLQAANTVQQRPLSGPVLLNATIAPEIPTLFTGMVDYSTYGNYTPRLFDSSLQPVYAGFVTNSSIPSPVYGCPELCHTYVQAAALFQEDCSLVSNLSGPMDIVGWREDSDNNYPPICAANNAAVDTCPLFSIMLNMVAKPGPWETVGAWIGYTDEDVSANWTGQYNTKLCTFRPAIASYSVMVGNGSVTVDYQNVTFVSWANNTRMDTHNSTDRSFNTTLVSPQNHESAAVIQNTAGGSVELIRVAGGIIELAKQKWDTTFNIRVEHDNTPASVDFVATPVLVSKYMANPEEYYDINADPLPRWSDPSNDILATLNELMFRTSVEAARNLSEPELLARIDPGLTVATEIIGNRAESVPAFHTRWKYYAAACAIQLACVVLVAWTYWGYWRLGRPVSLSPLEIAKAFDAPLLKEVNSNMRGKEMSRHIGDIKVQYGAVGMTEGEDVHARRLIFHLPEHVDRPRDKFSYHP